MTTPGAGIFRLSAGRFAPAQNHTGLVVGSLTVGRRLTHSERDYRYEASCRCGSDFTIGQAQLKDIIARGTYAGCRACRSSRLRPVGAPPKQRRLARLAPTPTANVVCEECCGLPWRRAKPRCRGTCREPYEAEAKITIEDVLRQPMANRREII